jgi:OPA family glycerol-3-phosphate transporter-like MFS transporter
MFAIGTLAATVLYFITGGSAVGSILAMAVLVGSMHGVNLILICMVPHYYKDTGRVSLVSGLLNSCTYVGSALSTYGVALLTEQIGWNSTILLWALIALAGTLICLALVPVWKNVHLKG